jgi:hypothetical protein
MEEAFETVLLQAAEAERLYAEEHDGLYTHDVEALERYGLTMPADMELSVPFVNPRPNFHRNYCIQATDRASDVTMQYDNLQELRPGPCTDSWFGG